MMFLRCAIQIHFLDTITDSIKFNLIKDCNKAIQDIIQSEELEVETPTQREFLNYIYKNSGSKEDLINIIMRRLEPDITYIEPNMTYI